MMKRTSVVLTLLILPFVLISCSKLGTKPCTQQRYKIITQYLDPSEISYPELVSKADNILSRPNTQADSLTNADPDTCHCYSSYNEGWRRYIIYQVKIDSRRETIDLDVQGMGCNDLITVNVPLDSLFCGEEYSSYKLRYAPGAEIMVKGSCAPIYGRRIFILDKQALPVTIITEFSYE